MIALTPEPPYYAVIFSSYLKNNLYDYEETFEKLMQIAGEIDGFIGMESVRNDFGISISYWKDKSSIEEWKENFEHIIAKKRGKQEWYKNYSLKIARVEYEKNFKSHNEL